MKKRSVKISGHLTSITLEEPFWEALKSIAKQHGVPLHALIAGIDQKRQGEENLSSALRVYVLQSVQQNLAKN